MIQSFTVNDKLGQFQNNLVEFYNVISVQFTLDLQTKLYGFQHFKKMYSFHISSQQNTKINIFIIITIEGLI